MMKKTIFILGASALCITACHDYRNDYMVEDSVYLRSADATLVEEYSVYDAVNRIGVVKAGRGFSSCTVTLGIDNSLVGDYNYDNHTDYVPLPKSLYNASDLDGKTVTIGKDDVRAMVEIKWDPAAMVSEMSSTTDKYVIPVCIKSASIDIQEAKSLLLVRPILSTLAPRADNNPVTCRENNTATVKLGLILSAPVDTKDVTVHLAFTPKALTVGGKDYAAAPAGSVTLRKESVVIPAGVSELDFQVDLDMNGIEAGNDLFSGEIAITGVEVRKTSNADKARADESSGEVLTFMPVTKDKMNILVTRTHGS